MSTATRHLLVVKGTHPNGVVGTLQVVPGREESAIARLGVQARDLRLLDGHASSPAAILCRERAFVCNLLFVKAIVAAGDRIQSARLRWCRWTVQNPGHSCIMTLQHRRKRSEWQDLQAARSEVARADVGLINQVAWRR